jgi:hypothetical protein
MIAPKKKIFMAQDKPSLLLEIVRSAFSSVGTAEPIDDEGRAVD